MQSESISQNMNHHVEAVNATSGISGSVLKRRLFLAAGFLFVGIGVLGIVLPILDTTPFMLIAAYCFGHSSEKWHQWLLKHPLFGEYLSAFREKRGLTIKQKWRIAAMMTVMMSISALHGLGPMMLSVLGGIWVGCMGVLYFCRTAPTPVGLRAATKPVGGVA